MSMPNGEDPKNPKAQSEVKVTAKRPAAEPPQKKYTWDDVSRNIETQERNKAKKAQYESDVASYNKAMKLYTSGGIPTVSEKELSSLKGSNVGGKKATFSSNKDIMSAARDNEMYEKGLKSGEYVDIDDPRIDPKTRYFLKGATIGSTSSDILGEKTGKISVPYEIALGKSKPTKWADVYGGKDFDPYEFEKASKSGKLDQFMKKTGMRAGDFAASEIGARTQYKVPTAPKGPQYEQEESIDRTKLPAIKMEQQKKKPIKGLSISKTKAPAPEEKADFTDPSRARITTKFKKTGVASNASRGGRGVGSGSTMKLGNYQTGRNIFKKDVAGREYEREAKMAKAYFGGGFEGKGAAGIAERKSLLKQGKAETKASIKEARKAGDAERVSVLRGVKKDYRGEIKQARQASKYLGKLGGDKETGGVSEGQKFKNTGKIKYYTPEAMKGFAGSKQDTYNRYANAEARMSTDNPANRNTIPKQMETVETRRSRAQRKEEQNIQKNVMKKMQK